MPGPFYDVGTYHVQILDIALGESKVKEDGSGGNPQVVIRVKVIEICDGDNTLPVTQQYDRIIYLTCTEKGKEYVLKKLRWAGWEGEKFETLAKDLLGRGVRGVCRHDVNKGGKYDGQLSEKWDLELPPKESKPLENKPAAAKKLNALFGKMLKDKPAADSPAPQSSEPEPTAQPAREPAAASVGPPEDEIPF